MYFTEKSEYNEIRERSMMQWLDEMEKHPDIAVRDGVALTRSYVQHLNDEIAQLKRENELKAEFLKKLKSRK